MPVNRYYSTLRERKLTNPPKKAISAGSTRAKPARATGWPTAHSPADSVYARAKTR